MRDRFLLEALDDLRVLAEWYERLQLGLGDRLTDRVEEFVQARLNSPRLCGRVGRPPRGREVRVGSVRRFSVLVHYEVAATEVVVLSVIHARSRSRPWRRRLNSP